MNSPTARSPRRPHAQRRAEAQERLLEAAMTCVADRGVEGFTLADVGKAADLSRGLVNYHFGTKPGLVDRLVDWLFEAEGIGDLAPQDAKGLEPLLRAVAGYFDNLVEEPTACRALCVLQGYALSNDHFAAKLADLNVRAVASIEAHLRAGLDRGEVDGSVHAKNHAMVILTGVRAAVMGHLLQPQAMTVEELRMAFVGALRRSLQANP